jgi:hypothetical protein
MCLRKTKQKPKKIFRTKDLDDAFSRYLKPFFFSNLVFSYIYNLCEISAVLSLISVKVLAVTVPVF